MLPSRFPILPEVTFTKICKSFTAEEVYTALHSMDPYKAPGPDGYQALFFQKNRDLVGDKVCALALDVLRGTRFPDGLNDTFIARIPKLDNPQHISQFRPIGLCNVIYKIITKAIA